MSDVRVLYLGTKPIGSRDATGQTLGSVYMGLPPDSLLQLVEDTGQVVGPNIVPLPSAATPVSGVLHWSLKKLRASKLPAPGVAHDGLNAAVQREENGAAGRLRLEAKAVSDLSPVRLPAKTVRAIGAFRPTVIHSLLGSGKMMRLALALSRRFDLPIVPHFMDDWIGSLYPNRELGGLAQRESIQLLHRVLGRSSLCLTIGSAMASEYRTRLGVECIAVGNSVDVADYSFDLDRHDMRAAEQQELVYVGGLHLGRADVLIELARVMRDTVMGRWTLVAHTPAVDAERFLPRHLPSNLRWGGEIDPGDVPRKLVEADALLFVESEKPSISRFTQFSVSTKVPQYLAANRPIIVVGPPGQASVEEFRAHGAHVRVARSREAGSLGLVVAGLSEWVGAGEQRFAGARQFPEQFDAMFVRRRFAEALRSAVETHRGSQKPVVRTRQ